MRLTLHRRLLLPSLLTVLPGLGLFGAGLRAHPSLSLLLAVFLALGLSLLALHWRRRLGHLEALSRQLSSFASGDLSTRLSFPDADAEMDLMSRNTNGVGISQSSVLAEISATAEMLGRNARIFLSTCENASEQSEAMRSATNTIAAALEEISASISTIAAQSNQIDATARSIASSSHRLHQTSEATSASFSAQGLSLDSTARDLSTAQERIDQLQESSRAITDFASQILDLVSKTRLLALNATIEAARAGEAGKSFAVVAGEVKELSALTSQMAEGIQGRIGEIDERTRSVAASLGSATRNMETLRADVHRSAQSAQEQTQMVSETDRALQEILKGTADVSHALTEAQTGIGEIERNAIDTDARAVRLHRIVGRVRTHAEDLGRAGKTLEGSIEPLKGPQPFFPWTEGLSLGIEIMDEQHKVLVRLLNHLHDLVASDGPKGSIGTVLSQLAAYTHFHFQAEERYMKSFHYPDLTDHQEIHRTFLAEIDGLMDSYRCGQTIDGKALLEQLRNWLTGHIMGIDRKYAQLVLAKSSER